MDLADPQAPVDLRSLYNTQDFFLIKCSHDHDAEPPPPPQRPRGLWASRGPRSEFECLCPWRRHLGVSWGGADHPPWHGPAPLTEAAGSEEPRTGPLAPFLAVPRRGATASCCAAPDGSDQACPGVASSRPRRCPARPAESASGSEGVSSASFLRPPFLYFLLNLSG